MALVGEMAKCVTAGLEIPEVSLKMATPLTSNWLLGLATPIPTLPFGLTVTRVLPPASNNKLFPEVVGPMLKLLVLPKN